jgi:hypothetical protein
MHFEILACACLETSGLASLGQTSTRQQSKTSGQIHEAQRRRGSPLNHLAKPRLPLCVLFMETAAPGYHLRAGFFQSAHSVDIGAINGSSAIL